MSIIADLVQRIYTPGSLSSTGGELRFELSNRLDDMEVTAVRQLRLDGCDLDPAGVELRFSGSGGWPRE